MQPSRHERIKWAYVTHAIPESELAGWRTADVDPVVGDVGVFRVLSIGQHRRIEDRHGVPQHLFPGDLVALAFGNRYATDQYEGYVPTIFGPMHVLSLGGVCGTVGSRNERMPDPTRLEMLGYAVDAAGRTLSTRRHALPRRRPADIPRPATIVTVGASMNSGKTTTCAMAVRGLVASGRKVVAAKLTGTGANKDLQFMRDAGADLVLDFTDCGWPSTCRLTQARLLRIARLLRARLLEERPDAIVCEIADGIFQRETALLLQSAAFRAQVDFALFAAVDALSAESGQRVLERAGIPLLGSSGIVSSSLLGQLETERCTGLPCLNSRELAEGGIVAMLEGRQALHPRRHPKEMDASTRYAPAPS